MGEGTATKPELGRRRIIERPRLIRMLDESPERIKLLVAPAGYGKTTLARQWLAERPSSWHVCTPASADVAGLASGIADAVEQHVPGASAGLLARLPLLKAEDEPEALAMLLADAIQPWPSAAWIAVDDYHLMHGVASVDRFIETLLHRSRVNVLLLSRHRPRYVSARKILYGECFELGREELAMTAEEAAELLTETDVDTAALMQLARGWPAVLSLASISRARIPDLAAAPHLYEFFAEEIFRRLPAAVGRSLTELALYEGAGSAVALRELPQRHQKEVLALGTDTGFLIQRGDGVDMHPLLRAFLLRKLDLQPGPATAAMVDRAALFMIERGLWDDAYALVERHRRAELIPALLTACMYPLLESGRTRLLERLVALAQNAHPIVQLAKAEIAFRNGRFHEAEGLARAAATDASSDDIQARALVSAGRAAHAASREHEAAIYFKRVRATDCSEEVRRVAQLGELAAAIELETDEAVELLAALGPPTALVPDERVVAVSRMINLETRFSLPVSIAEGHAMWQLLDHVRDPLSRCSFRNVFGYSLAAMGQLDETLQLMDEQLADAERFHLDFVIPYSLVNRALVASMRHEYLASQELLDEAEERALHTGDQTAYYIAWAVRTRLYNAQGAYDAALTRAFPATVSQTRSLHGELAASYAVALAGVGDTNRAVEYATRAEEASRAIEVSATAPAALAIAAARNGDSQTVAREARRALHAAVTCGMLECFVSAYRGCPELVLALFEARELHDDVVRVLTVAGDAPLIRSEAKGNVLTLSRREREVLALLARGLSNRQIGAELFISHVTVKVHVRHIFEKLGVHSRAEAAVRGAQLNRP